MFDLPPWRLWVLFGACCYALRINALLVLGHSTGTLGQQLPGTMMHDATQAVTVKLVPTKVIRSQDAFGAATIQSIPARYNPSQINDWISTGCVAVNVDGGGADADIFFALTDAETQKVVVILDQRKRQFGKFQPSHAEQYFDKLAVCPAFLKEQGVRLVRGMMNCTSASNFVNYDVPPDCFLLTRDESERFHGTLSYHPACLPVVPINSASKTALKTLFKGNEEDVDLVVEAILKKRTEPSGGFSIFDEPRCFICAKQVEDLNF